MSIKNQCSDYASTGSHHASHDLKHVVASSIGRTGTTEGMLYGERQDTEGMLALRTWIPYQAIQHCGSFVHLVKLDVTVQAQETHVLFIVWIEEAPHHSSGPTKLHLGQGLGQVCAVEGQDEPALGIRNLGNRS